MSKDQIIEQLKSLKEKRLFSSEVEKLIEPFKGKVYSFDMTFAESERSFGSQPDPAYNNGHKMKCEIAEGTEITVLVPADQEEFLKGLKSGDTLNLTLQLLGYDGLYSRAVFGKADHKKADQSEETPTEDPVTEDIEEEAPSLTEENPPEITPDIPPNITPETPPDIPPKIPPKGHRKKTRSLSFPVQSDKKEKIPKWKRSKADKEKAREYYVILTGVPQSSPEKKSLNSQNDDSDYEAQLRRIITTIIQKGLPQFKLTLENFKMWSIRNFLSLNQGHDEAQRLVADCPTLIKKENAKWKTESLKKKLKYYCAEVSVHDHKELVRIYGDPPEPKLTKTFKIPESRTVGLNFKDLKKKPKEHILDLQFAHLVALLFYCISGLNILFGWDNFSRTFFGICFAAAGVLAVKFFTFVPESPMYPSRKLIIKQPVNIEEKVPYYIHKIKLGLYLLGALIIWAGMTKLNFIIMGIMFLALGRWSPPFIKIIVEKELKKYNEGFINK